jgi:hypothetical protein
MRGLRAAAYEFAQAGAEVTRISLGDFPLPIYDGDLQQQIRRAEDTRSISSA